VTAVAVTEAPGDPAGTVPVPGPPVTTTTAPARAPRWRDRALRVGAVAVVLALWQVVTVIGIWPTLIVPRPSAVWAKFVLSVTTHDGVRGIEGAYLWEHVAASGRRLVIGVLAAVGAGVPLGLLMATVRPARVVLEPFVDFVRSLPPLAYFSLLVIWFGIEDTSKVWLLFLAAVTPIALSIVAGVERSRVEWIEAARSLGATPFQAARTTLLPAVLPELFTAVRLAVGFAFTTIVAAETLNGLPGIGGLAWSTRKFNQTDTAILCVIVIGLCAVAIDLGVRALERRLVPWKGRG
jgi:taurine transport system permease protein